VSRGIVKIEFEGQTNPVGRDNGNLPLENRDASGSHDFPSVAVKCGGCGNEEIIEGKKRISFDALRERGWREQVVAHYNDGGVSCHSVGWVTSTRWVCPRCADNGEPATAWREVEKLDWRELRKVSNRWCCGS
jgi:hypothetical protein